MPLTRSIVALAAAVSVAGCAPTLNVMTFNVRYLSDEGKNRWADRRPVMAALIRDARPDVIGSQELWQRQGDDLVADVPGYRWFGRDRRGGHADEHMGIFYRTDRLRLIRDGDFWLSETPEQTGSQAAGTDLPRMATWGVFEMVGARPRRFVLVNTHLPHRNQDAHARTRAAALIVSRLGAIAEGLPLILTGDFNATPDSAAYRTLDAALDDAWTTTARRSGPEGTFHDFTGRAEKRIDYIFLRDFDAKSVTTDTYHQGEQYPSDHFPVSARLRFTRQGAQ